MNWIDYTDIANLRSLVENMTMEEQDNDCEKDK